MFVRKNCVGITLIELMLALVLSLSLIYLVFEIYLIAEKNRLTQTALTTIQENTQVVTQLLKRQVRASTYFGCAKLTDNFPFVNHTHFVLNAKNKIKKYQDADMKSGTDGIQFWHASIENTVLIKTMRGYSDLYVTSSLPISIQDNLIISDCKTAEAFQVKEIVPFQDGTEKIISTKPLTKLFSVHAEVNKLEIKSYYIGSESQLVSRDSYGNKTELADNISQMKIFFSRIEDNQLIEHPLNELIDSDEIKSVSFVLNFVDKTWPVYVALS